MVDFGHGLCCADGGTHRTAQHCLKSTSERNVNYSGHESSPSPMERSSAPHVCLSLGSVCKVSLKTCPAGGRDMHYGCDDDVDVDGEKDFHCCMEDSVTALRLLFLPSCSSRPSSHRRKPSCEAPRADLIRSGPAARCRMAHAIVVVAQ